MKNMTQDNTQDMYRQQIEALNEKMSEAMDGENFLSAVLIAQEASDLRNEMIKATPRR